MWEMRSLQIIFLCKQRWIMSVWVYNTCLVGTGLAWAISSPQSTNKSPAQSRDVDESRHLHLQSDASEPSLCMWRRGMFVRDEKAEELLGRAFTISITREDCTLFYTTTQLRERQPYSAWPRLRERRKDTQRMHRRTRDSSQRPQADRGRQKGVVCVHPTEQDEKYFKFLLTVCM